MSVKITKLFRTLNGKDGKLFYLKNGRRFLLADCSTRLEITSQEDHLPVAGNKALVSKHYLTIAICEDMELKEEVDTAFLKSVSRFEIVMFLQRRDGVQERFVFDNIAPIEINLDGEWEFQIEEPYTLIRRLLAEF